ncbi:MAG: hypothetical protein ACI8UO_002030 [Verrucomicrobiales bacterium]|jgi:hypothetical protein
MIILNIVISICFAVMGVVHIQKENSLGYLLLLCILVHWSFYAARRKTGK